MNSFDPIWCAIYWDAPTDTPEARTAERRFRKLLRTRFGSIRGKIIRGTWLLCPRPASVAEAELIPQLPPDGELHIVRITDKQIEKSRIVFGDPRVRAGGPADGSR